MALTQKDTYNLIRELSEYGTAIYYLIEKREQGASARKSLSFSEIENIIYKENMEQVGLIFPKMIGKISLDDLDQAEAKYQQLYTKKDCLKRFLENNQNKYLHLQEIQDIALTEELVDQIIQKNTYQEALNLEYTDKILSYFEQHPKDEYFSTKETLHNYRVSLEQLKKENEQKLSSNINQYYISTITE